jgi:pantothenate kinase
MKEIDFSDLPEIINGIVEGQQGRSLIALVGAPASGKSTLAVDLARSLGPTTQVVPMDGFHHNNDVLDRMNRRAFKGAPDTFDGHGFLSKIRALTEQDQVSLPGFDRQNDCTVPNVHRVGPDTKIAIVEGNYLLLNRAPWNELAQFWTTSIYLDVPEGTLTQRLLTRWRDHGLDDDTARRKTFENDLPNARLVAKSSLPAEYVIRG